MSILCVAYSLVDQWALGLLTPLATITNTVMDMGVLTSFQVRDFNNVGVSQETEWLDHVVLRFLRNY